MGRAADGDVSDAVHRNRAAVAAIAAVAAETRNRNHERRNRNGHGDSDAIAAASAVAAVRTRDDSSVARDDVERAPGVGDGCAGSAHTRVAVVALLQSRRTAGRGAGAVVEHDRPSIHRQAGDVKSGDGRAERRTCRNIAGAVDRGGGRGACGLGRRRPAKRQTAGGRGHERASQADPWRAPADVSQQRRKTCVCLRPRIARRELRFFCVPSTARTTLPSGAAHALPPSAFKQCVVSNAARNEHAVDCACIRKAPARQEAINNCPQAISDSRRPVNKKMNFSSIPSVAVSGLHLRARDNSVIGVSLQAGPIESTSSQHR